MHLSTLSLLLVCTRVVLQQLVGKQICIALGVIRAIYRSDSLVLTMELASCLDDKLLTIGDDSALSDLLPAVLALNEAVHSCAVSLVLAVCK